MRAFCLIVVALSTVPLASAQEDGVSVCFAAGCVWDSTYTYRDATCANDGLRHASTSVGVGVGIATVPGGPYAAARAAAYGTDYCSTKNGSTVREHGIGATVVAPGALVMAWWGESEGSARFPDGCTVGASVGTLLGWTPAFVECPLPPPDAGWGDVLP